MQPPARRVQRRRGVRLLFRAHQEMVGEEGRVEPRQLLSRRGRVKSRRDGGGGLEDVESARGGAAGGSGEGGGDGGFSVAGALLQRRGAHPDEEVRVGEQGRRKSKIGGREKGPRRRGREDSKALRAKVSVVGRRRRREKRSKLSRGGGGLFRGRLKGAVIVRRPVVLCLMKNRKRAER